MGRLGKWFAPLFAPIGIDWRGSVALLTGFVAKEIVVSTMGVLYAVGGVIFSFLTWLFFLATRELLYLLIQVEENTRDTAERISIAEESSED